MQRYMWVLVAAMLALLVMVPVSAQGSQFVFVDETGNLDRAQIQDAADPLIERGATVAIYMVRNGGDEDFTRRLAEDGLRSNDGRLRRGLIAVYVSTNPRTALIRFEDEWNEALAVNDNYRAILQSELAPNLSAGQSTQAYVSTLAAVDSAIASPPVPGGGNTFNINLIPVVLGVFVLVLGFATWGALSRRRSAAQARERARSQTEESRQTAGVAIVEVGRLLQNAEEKSQYDRVSYDPEDVQQLSETQQQIAARFAQTQQQFDETENQLQRYARPTIAQYTTAANAYKQIQESLAGLQQELEQLAARRSELDQLAQQTAEELERTKKVLTDVPERLILLRGEIPDPAAVIAPVQRHMTVAEQALANNHFRQAQAAMQVASALAQELTTLIDTYIITRAGVVNGRKDAEELTEQGYRMDVSHAYLDQARAILTEVARTLQQGEDASIHQAHERLQEAHTALDNAVRHGRELPRQREENERILAEIEQQGRELNQAIIVGRKTFDAVDEFAESTWSDIRGNGSEAQAAAERAHYLWQKAHQRNTMEVQEFIEAKTDLDAAREQIVYAHQLIDTITQRLKDLEAARDAARSELEAATSDIERGWQFIRSNDADVGKTPEQKLHQAAALLDEAHAEMQKPKPDWLVLVQKARAANSLADDSLVGARSEAEAMAKLRGQAERAQTTANAELQKIVKFVELHNEDIDPQHRQALEALQQQSRQSAALLRRAAKTEEDERRRALEEAYAGYTGLEQESGKLYLVVQSDFQRFEQLRAELNTELTNARNAITATEQEALAYHLDNHTSEVQQIRGIRQRFDAIQLPITGEHNLRNTIQLARSLQQEANMVHQDIYQHHARTHHHDQSDNDLGGFVAGMAAGALIDSITDSGGWGGSGSWSGGGSDHDRDSGWGGSGGGGGIDWGGGGGGGIDWGGGGGGGVDW